MLSPPIRPTINRLHVVLGVLDCICAEAVGSLSDANISSWPISAVSDSSITMPGAGGRQKVDSFWRRSSRHAEGREQRRLLRRRELVDRRNHSLQKLMQSAIWKLSLAFETSHRERVVAAASRFRRDCVEKCGLADPGRTGDQEGASVLDCPPQARLELSKLSLAPHQSLGPHPGMIVRPREPAPKQDSGFPGRDLPRAAATVVTWTPSSCRMHDSLQYDRLRPGPRC